MDGDQTAKTFEQGANSAMRDTEGTSGIHETVKQTVITPVRFDCCGPTLTPSSPPLARRPPAPAQACSPKTVQWARCSTVRCPFPNRIPSPSKVPLEYELTNIISRRCPGRNSPEDWWTTRQRRRHWQEFQSRWLDRRHGTAEPGGEEIDIRNLDVRHKRLYN